MKIIAEKASVILAALVLGMVPLQAAHSESDVDTWQLARLLAPSEIQRASEQRKQVFIYQGVKDKEVEKAMDEHFDRIEWMMFTNVIVTDEKGAVRRDPTTGVVITEGDDC
ncbi:MAG: hypothetical protein JSW10_03390 [Pseudomonadota bacterium]|nr:MAG: hypothetical protein JSW10_03390 [Pseudomonadota bacterium]